MRQQYKERHPFTGAAPGGWGWTPRPGSVPDADDSPGALLALSLLDPQPPLTSASPATEPGALPTLSLLDPRWTRWWHRDGVGADVEKGLFWLLNLQNSDGGWPTFCRGWTKLPFDRSGSDLTAHAIRALWEWLPLEYPDSRYAIDCGFAFLAKDQRQDGSWLPLWFGNQHAPDAV